MKNFICASMTALLLLGASNACAFVDLPRIDPPQPHVGERLVLIVYAGHCDGLSGAINVSIEGTFVLATIDGTRSDAICGVPPRDHMFDIGALPAGDYTLQLDYRHHPVEFPDDFTVETIGSISFSVSPMGTSGIASVPTTGHAGLAGLALLLLTVSAVALRHRLR